MKINYKAVTEWPFLSWIAIIKNSSELIVLHGSDVETKTEFFCEAVWDGEFIKGDFDNTDIVFGSGARVRGNEIHFVGSGSTLDRLHHYITPKNDIIVSNSLVCLLSFIDEKLDPTYKNYYSDYLSISKGINKYKKILHTINDRKINITYYHNLKWDGNNLCEYKKNERTKDFGSFNKYYQFLSNSINKLFSNATDSNRKFIFKKLGTMSKGYDSPTVTALAKNAGLNEVISFDKDRDGNNDCGDDIARAMGMNVTKVSTDAWKHSELSEIPFIAGEGRGEDVQFYGIPDHLIRNSIFLTGYYGDKVWTKHPINHEYSDKLIRGDIAGLSLTEYRLWKGFIHVPVPFIGARQIADINKVSNLSEMKKWNVPRAYNRPICRRIVEDLGIPGNAFGQRKQVTTVELSHRWTFLTENSQKHFYSWLKCQRNIFKQKGKLFPNKCVRFISNLNRRVLLKSITISTKFFSIDINKFNRSEKFRQLFYDYWFNYLHPWAVEIAKARYKAKDASIELTK